MELDELYLSVKRDRIPRGVISHRSASSQVLRRGATVQAFMVSEN
jgi:hypothetical protein